MSELSMSMFANSADYWAAWAKAAKDEREKSAAALSTAQERIRVLEEARADEIADAYRRGVMWARENPPEFDAYATKAASDYADKWLNRAALNPKEKT